VRLPPIVIDFALVGLALLDATFSSGREGGAPMVLSVLAAVGLAARRRWPYLSFALSLPALFVAYVLIAPLAALYTIAATARNRWPVVVCAILTTTGYYLPWPLSDFHWPHSPDGFLSLIYTVVYVGAPVALGVLAQTKRDLFNSLQETNASRDREQRLLGERILAQERARLAREMHDVVSHQVSLIAVQAGALGVTAPDENVRVSAQTIRQLSVRTLDELRHMIGVLRRSDTAPITVSPQPRLADIPRTRPRQRPQRHPRPPRRAGTGLGRTNPARRLPHRSRSADQREQARPRRPCHRHRQTQRGCPTRHREQRPAGHPTPH